MYEVTMTVLTNIIDEASCRAACGEARGALRATKSFDFVFMLHLMNRTKDLDILNAMDLVSSTKPLLQTFRGDDFIDFLMKVKSVCRNFDIIILLRIAGHNLNKVF